MEKHGRILEKNSAKRLRNLTNDCPFTAQGIQIFFNLRKHKKNILKIPNGCLLFKPIKNINLNIHFDIRKMSLLNMR